MPTAAARQSTTVAAGWLVAIGLAGILGMRQFGGVPFSVPSWPWYQPWQAMAYRAWLVE
jgi:hypothetical protein